MESFSVNLHGSVEGYLRCRKGEKREFGELRGATPEYQRAWRLAPDIVAEVVSPNQYRPGMAEKAQRYLAAGVRLVWIIWPRYQQVDVWRLGAGQQPAAKLGLGDALDGLDILPGFTYPLERLFA